MMAEKCIYLVATDYPAEFYADAPGSPATTADQRLLRLTGARRFAASSRDRLLRAEKLGARIAFGSDEYYQVPGRTRGQASLLTLQAYQDDDLSPVDVIRTATVNAADLAGIDDRVGTMEAGKLADIISVDGDPLRDVKDLQRVRFVMKGGKVIRNDPPARR